MFLSCIVRPTIPGFCLSVRSCTGLPPLGTWHPEWWWCSLWRFHGCPGSWWICSHRKRTLKMRLHAPCRCPPIQRVWRRNTVLWLVHCFSPGNRGCCHRRRRLPCHWLAWLPLLPNRKETSEVYGLRILYRCVVSRFILSWSSSGVLRSQRSIGLQVKCLLSFENSFEIKWVNPTPVRLAHGSESPCRKWEGGYNLCICACAQLMNYSLWIWQGKE